MHKLDYALRMARMGFEVFPLVPGTKRPLTLTGFKSSTKNEALINEWWAKSPEANIGVHTAGHVVIDLDVKDTNGIESFCDYLGVEEWELYDNFIVHTPTGGRHIYFNTPDTFSSGIRILPGVDVRAEGGYVVGPGSTLNGATYEIKSYAEIQPLPEPIKSLLRKPREKAEDTQTALVELDTSLAIRRAKEFLSTRLPAVSGNAGNAHTYKTFAVLKDFGLSREMALELIYAPGGWNDRCEPSWSFAELETISINVYKYGINQPGELAGTPEEFFEGIEDVENVIVKDKFEGIREIAYFGDEIVRRGKRREYVIPGWVLAEGYTAITATRGCGKSTIILDMALRLATDMDWHGHQMQKGRTVIYFCAEDDEGAETLISAWKKRNGEPLLEDRFVLFAGAPDLMSVNSVQLFTEFLQEKFPTQQCVIFVDTWQRATCRASQIKDEEMQVCVHAIEAMAKKLRGPAIIACHPSKGGQGIMGSGVTENSSHGILSLIDDAGGKKLQVDRIKGAGAGNYMYFNFELIPLEEKDQFGNEYTAVLPQKIAGQDNSNKTQAMEQQRSALAHVIRELESQRGNEGHTGRYYLKSMALRLVGSNDQKEPYTGPVLFEQVEDRDVLGDITEENTYAGRLVLSLFSAGLNRCDFRQMWAKLKEFFPDGSRYTYNDGVQLVVGKNGLLSIEKSVDSVAA